MDDNNFGYLIHVANVMVGNYFNSSIHRIVPELTGVQFTILIYLYRNQPGVITQRMVTDYLHLRHPTVRHIVKLMLRKGLITSRALPADRRQIQVTISQKGNRLIKKHLGALDRDSERMDRMITDHISDRDQRILKRGLGQIIKNFEK